MKGRLISSSRIRHIGQSPDVAASHIPFARSPADTDTIHWEWRDLICQTAEKGAGDDKITEDAAQCTVALRENEKDTKRRKAPKGAGCFEVPALFSTLIASSDVESIGTCGAKINVAIPKSRSPLVANFFSPDVKCPVTPCCSTHSEEGTDNLFQCLIK
uniref:DUF7808 domain-containing protein n=1 Tax=Globodera pallida TaxID=36090 RepID=A0A183C2A3_GLOPA